MTADDHAQSLEDLAEALGVTRGYHDGTGRWRRASDDAVFAIVRALGAPVERIEDAAEALRAHHAAEAQCGLPAMVSVTAGREESLYLRCPSSAGRRASVVVETGETLAATLEACGSDAIRVRIPGRIPAGYHRLRIEGANDATDVALLAAPPRLPAPEHGWGLFAPLYGLGAARAGSGFASYGDLVRLAEWMIAGAGPKRGDRKRAYLGTLPLLACYFEEPFEPSPYSPISRAFWSELYVDPRVCAEYAESDDDARLPASGAPHLPYDGTAHLRHDGTAHLRHDGTARLRHDGSLDPTAIAGRIDYRAEMKSRRRSIEALLRSLDARGDGLRRHAFENTLEDDDELTRYAAYRAAVERHGCTWEQWPERARSGVLRAGVDYDGEAFRYHAYAQWLAREQLAAAAAASPAGLYLDLPLGSHGEGYDTWRHRSDFALGVSAGAPPDAVFDGGQDWGFPPLHPEHARRGGYASVRAALRHHFAHASLLRIDHVMGLHRLFWIPRGFTAADGVYVRSHAGELWSILAIEASRARGGAGAAVVGEDLGTVPDEVRAEMHARGALRLHVVPFELRGGAVAAIAAPPEDSLACLGTHDMATFATWWDAATTDRERVAAFLGCSVDPAPAFAALLTWMAASPAAVVIANLEDLWLETQRQNLPGTASSEGNWQRPFALGFDEFAGDAAVSARRDLVRGDVAAAGTER